MDATRPSTIGGRFTQSDRPGNPQTNRVDIPPTPDGGVLHVKVRCSGHQHPIEIANDWSTRTVHTNSERIAEALGAPRNACDEFTNRVIPRAHELMPLLLRLDQAPIWISGQGDLTLREWAACCIRVKEAARDRHRLPIVQQTIFAASHFRSKAHMTWCVGGFEAEICQLLAQLTARWMSATPPSESATWLDSAEAQIFQWLWDAGIHPDEVRRNVGTRRIRHSDLRHILTDVYGPAEPQPANPAPQFSASGGTFLIHTTTPMATSSDRRFVPR